VTRSRKVRLGEIVRLSPLATSRLAAAVDYRREDSVGEYRVVPLDPTKQRAGRAVWVRSGAVSPLGEKSAGTVRVYRANLSLEAIAPRDCDCQCCIHGAEDPRWWTVKGEWRGETE